MADLALEIRTNQSVTEAKLADLSENVESVLQKQAEYIHMLEKDQALSKQEIVELIRVRQRSLDNTEQEWINFFRPILSNLERVVKRRIFHVIEEKLSCEKKMDEGDPVVTSSDFDLDKEWAAFEGMVTSSAIHGSSISGLKTLSSLKSQLEKAISYPNEIPLAFYHSVNHSSYPDGFGGRMYLAYSFMYVVTSRSVYGLSRSSPNHTKLLRDNLDNSFLSSNGIGSSSFGQQDGISIIPGSERYQNDHHFLVYRFARPLTKQLAKIITQYVKTKLKPVSTHIREPYDSYSLNGEREVIVREKEAFEALLTSIPGTYYYPLKSGWKSVEAEDGAMTYMNTNTGEVVYEPPYQYPPEVHE